MDLKMARYLREFGHQASLEKLVKHELAQNKRFSLKEIGDDWVLFFNHGERGGNLN